jgi:phosphatidylglycerol:prolipoprotein diacylglycerol transferase
VIVLVLLTHRALVRRGTSLLDRPGLILAVLLGAAVGGRLHVLLEGRFLRGMEWSELARLLNPLSGGSAFYGAAAGVLLVLLLRRRRLPTGGLGGLADATVMGAGWAILIGRIGCLRQGCCLGHPITTPNAIQSGLHALLPHWPGLWACRPLPLWLGLWALASAYLSGRFRRPPLPGDRFLRFVALFSLGRFFLEFLRWDPGWTFPLEVSQIESLALVLATGAWLARRSASRPRLP